jgi:hypothetical protein
MKTIYLNDRILKTTDHKTLAQWWCALNRWQWPSELGEPEQPYVDGNPRRNLIMREIRNIIGHKECLREWNIDRIPGFKNE